MVDPFFHYGQNVLHFCGDMTTPASPVLATLGRVIRGQAAHISELQAALLDARQQLGEQELGAAHEPIVYSDSD